MSGIVGIFNRDGAPANRKLLLEMTRFMKFRGPDTQETWTDGEIGFGHALLRTTWQAAGEKQPCTLDGRVWITADCRIDAREDLIGTLKAAGRDPAINATDAELILHAYDAWRERCLEHLLGDFSFGIWDGGERRLFCARDHLGVKRFYYSRVGRQLLFGNTLDCIRLSPDVSGDLNDAAIADFLVYNSNQNAATTTFRDILQLPAAHYLTCTKDRLEIFRYWTLPVEDPVFYKRADDYVDHFRALLRSAVRDRLRTDRVGVFMSGGLDSPGLAATAREILEERSAPYDLRAYTYVFDRLVPHNERHYAGLVADALQIPIHFLAADGCGLYDRWDQPELRTPEPINDPRLALSYDQFAQASAHCRVMLYGEGPDNALYYQWEPYVLHLLKTFRWSRLLRDLGAHARFHREAPLLKGLRNRLISRRIKENRESDTQPRLRWIRPEIRKLATRKEPSTAHPFHPIAYRCITGILWEPLFKSCDAESTSFPMEVRHPYMDVRVIRYFMALPPIPWRRNKYLLRRSFRGLLPDATLQRPKTPVQGDPLVECARLKGVPQWTPTPSLSRYVDPEVVRTVLRQNQSSLWESLRPVSLNFFLALNESNVREYARGASVDERTRTKKRSL